MNCNCIKKNNLNEIADEVIKQIREIKDPFISPVIVFHNKRVEQWFKAFYLKNCSEVLMNVSFVTLPVFVNGIINSERKYTIVDKALLKKYVLKTLMNSSKYYYDTTNSEKAINFIFNKDGSINGIKLLEFANRLSGLFMDYEVDEVEIVGWQKELYTEAVKLAELDGCYTTGRLFASTQDLKFPDSPVFVIDNSYITKLFMSILNKDPYGNITVLSIEEKKELIANASIIAAPSKLREVEAVHSEICKIVKSDSSIKFNDIVVYAPNIVDYANSIRRVFQQDDEEYPALPFTIVGEYKEKQDMVNALKSLFDIANRQFFTRNDFYKFIKNPLIKWVKDITDEDIELWMNAIIDTNTHRNSENGDDWDYVRKRLLVSVMVSDEIAYDTQTEISGIKTLPYGTVGFDREQIEKFLSMIDLIADWSGLFKGALNKTKLDKAKMQEILSSLDNIFSLQGLDGEETDYLYIDVRKEIETIINLDTQLPADTFLLMLIDAPNGYSISPVGMFISGITFLNLNCDDVISAKYTFIMGMSSDNYPRADLDNELDISKKHKTNRELDELSIRNICANSEKIVFSYVKYNLQTEEEYFKSPLIPSSSNPEIEIGIDETRDYSELFTKKEFKNKSYIENIGNAVETEVKKNEVPPCENETDIIFNITDIKKFLENTFIYKYKKILGIEEDNDADILEEYEAIDADFLKCYDVIKESLKGAADEDVATLEIMKKAFPPAEIGDSYLEYFIKKASEVKEIIKDYQTIDKEDTVLSAKGQNITIKNNMDMAKKEEGDKLYYYDPVYFNLSEQEDKHFLSMYVESLRDIASKNDEKEYEVHLGGNGGKEKTYKINSNDATEVLCNICNDMANLNDIKYMDIELLEKYASKIEDINEDELPVSINNIKDDLKDHSSWKYFADKNLTDPYKSFGYEDKTLKEELKSELIKVRNYIKFDI